eukprot:COSAG04_NODE_1652_length_6047_cov_33.978648_2_plen_586_part_00
MMRKVLIVSIAVFLRKNVFDQTYCALFIIYASLALQFKFEPFESRIHNSAEYLSLVTTVLTLNGGIAGYGGSIASNESANEVLGVILFIINMFTSIVLLSIIGWEQTKKLEEKLKKRSLKKAAEAAKAKGELIDKFEDNDEHDEHDLATSLSKATVKHVEKLIEECEDDPRQFLALQQLFGEAYDLYALPNPEDMTSSSLVETIELIDEMDSHDALIALREVGLDHVADNPQLTLAALKSALIDHYSQALDSMSRQEVFDACVEAGLNPHARAQLEELQGQLRAHFQTILRRPENQATVNPLSRDGGGPPPETSAVSRNAKSLWKKGGSAAAKMSAGAAAVRARAGGGGAEPAQPRRQLEKTTMQPPAPPPRGQWQQQQPGGGSFGDDRAYEMEMPGGPPVAARPRDPYAPSVIPHSSGPFPNDRRKRSDLVDCIDKPSQGFQPPHYGGQPPHYGAAQPHYGAGMRVGVDILRRGSPLLYQELTVLECRQPPMNRGAAPVPPSNPYAAMLTQAQRQQISEAFEVFDTDGSGTFDIAELEVAMGALGFPPSADEMEDIFREVDTDGSGEVDLEEFTVAMAQIMNAV